MNDVLTAARGNDPQDFGNRGQMAMIAAAQPKPSGPANGHR